jgi:hypothetical protein
VEGRGRATSTRAEDPMGALDATGPNQRSQRHGSNGALPWPSGDVRNAPGQYEATIQDRHPVSQHAAPPMPASHISPPPGFESRPLPSIPSMSHQTSAGYQNQILVHANVPRTEFTSQGPFTHQLGIQRANVSTITRASVAASYQQPHSTTPRANHSWAMNSFPRRGSFNMPVTSAPMRIGMKNSRGGRKDYARFSSTDFQQPLASSSSESYYDIPSGHRRQASLPNCPNSSTEAGPYIHCSCPKCNERNRSVFVSVRELTVGASEVDVSTRLRIVLYHFGPIKDVFHVKGWPPGFIVL